MKYKKQYGFTVPELVITIGVAAIILSTAVPGISNTIKNNRLATHLNSVVADLYLARSEAAKRDVRVILCRSADPNRSTPSCGGTEKNWTSGYIIFADNGNYANNVYNEGTDILLRRGQAAASGVNLRTNWTWNNNLEFNPNGSTNEDGSTAMMSICDDRGTTNGRQIRVGPNGLPKLHTVDIPSCYP